MTTLPTANLNPSRGDARRRTLPSTPGVAQTLQPVGPILARIVEKAKP